jgi:predicted NAD/FAD-binding protein
VHCEESGLEYSGTSLNTLFAQRRNLLRPGFYRMLRDILRFNRESRAYIASDDSSLKLGDFLNKRQYSRQFTDYYLIPMGAAIWSAPPQEMIHFPLQFFVRFLDNHGLLNISDRPQWRVIRGGSRNYISALTAGFHQYIRLRTPVLSVLRNQDQDHRVRIQTQNGATEHFDRVVFACHADQALALLRDASTREKSILGQFKFQHNEVVLHTDATLLPRRRLAHACWNYHAPVSSARPATVTYLMNELQGLQSSVPYCVTLNKSTVIDPAKIIGHFNYSHPLYTIESHNAQQQHHQISGVNHTFFCGAYWGNGFHEDGVNSALQVCRPFGVGLN